MTYELTVDKGELGDIIQGLENVFQDCWDHASNFGCFDKRGIEEFKCTMEVGRLMERFILLYEFGEAHLADESGTDEDDENDSHESEKH